MVRILLVAHRTFAVLQTSLRFQPRGAKVRSPNSGYLVIELNLPVPGATRCSDSGHWRHMESGWEKALFSLNVSPLLKSFLCGVVLIPHYLNACRTALVRLSALYRKWQDNCDHKRKVINESLPRIDRALTKRVKYS